MKILQRFTAFVFALAFFTCTFAKAHADTTCSGGVCNTTIAGDPNAAVGNFQNPGSTATNGYTIQTSDNGTNFSVTLHSSDPNALPFSNLYFDTIASTPGTGSNLGFAFGQTSEEAFDPDTSTMYDLSGTGVTSLLTTDANGITILITIPNTFFLDNPLDMPFALTPEGTLVSLHLSQSFNYSVVGGGANFAPPTELGAANVNRPLAATPEPSSIALLGTGLIGLAGIMRRKSIKLA